jgi:branched-chain amino acid aminotransferase
MGRKIAMAFGGQIRTFFDGRWHDGNVPIMRAADHGTWQGTLVFDGARLFDGVTPDLDRHCARIVRSAEGMGMTPTHTGEEIMQIALDGLRAYAPGTAVYIRPMMWSTEGLWYVSPDPASTAFALCLEDIPMPAPGEFSLTVSPFLRPHRLAALTETKSGGLYANNGRMMREARQRGFDNALSLDHEGNVAETASTNVFLVRDGEVLTPAPNGMFLNGITRQRVIALLHADGVRVQETRLGVADFAAADEIFLTGNASKVVPVTRFEDRALAFGPVTRRARDLYWDFALTRRMAAE